MKLDGSDSLQKVEQKQISKNTVSALLDSKAYQERLSQLLGEKANTFIATVTSLTNASPQLQNCKPASIIAGAIMAAAMDLPVNKELGYAYIVPYGDSAQLQIGTKGFVQLAIRSGAYRTINVVEVYAGDIKRRNRLTGEIELEEEQQSEEVIGYLAYFSLLSGYEKWLYMTVEEIHKHGERFSKTYKFPNGLWKKDFKAMAEKTVLKRLLSKYGILSPHMQRAVMADQASIRETAIQKDSEQPLDDVDLDYIDVDFEGTPFGEGE